MMFPMGLINKNQKGFTLIELMIVIGISSIITGSIIMTIFQVVIGSARTNNHMIAVRQAQNAGYWVSHDAQMAQSVGLADESVDDPDGTRFPFTLTWVDWGNNEVHQVTYTLEDMTGGSKQLKRSHFINGTTETSLVAQFIDATEKDGKPQTRCEFTNGALIFTVTTAVGTDAEKRSETRVYEIVPRPGS